MTRDDKKGQVVEDAADIYEAFFVPALFQAWPQKLVATTAITTGANVLDVACGTGVLARYLATQVGKPDLVTGVDINVGMLAVAKRQAPNINWQQAAAEQLPFESHRFDAVFCQFGLMFFNDRTTAISEMYRVLRAGGQLAIAVWGTLENTPGYLAVCQLLQDLFGNDVAKEMRAPYALGDIEALATLFTSANIGEFTVTTPSAMARFSSVHDWMYTDIKGWTLADVLSDSQFERLLEHADSALQGFTNDDGSVSFATPAHIVSVTKT